MARPGTTNIGAPPAPLLPERVLSVVSVAGLAPFGAEGLDWFEGFGPGAPCWRSTWRSPTTSRTSLPKPKPLSPANDRGSSTLSVLAGGFGGFIDDDLASVGEWGFDTAAIVAPTLLLHGGRDQVVPDSHGGWLVRRYPSAELRLTRTRDISPSSTRAHRPWIGSGSARIVARYFVPSEL